MNLIKYTRAELVLSLSEFGTWLAKEVGRRQSYPRQQVCDWEHGRKSPRLKIRDVCAPVAARACVRDILTDLGMKVSDADVEFMSNLVIDCQR